MSEHCPLPAIPHFKDLPLDPSHPPHSAWIWGADDQLGALNFLTAESVTRAATEIQLGERIGLDWPLHLSCVPSSFRQRLKHEIFQIAPNVNVSQIQDVHSPKSLDYKDWSAWMLSTEKDDRVELNTQSSTQWDGFRHWAFPDGRHYNGFQQKDIEEGKSSRNGIHGK